MKKRMADVANLCYTIYAFSFISLVIFIGEVLYMRLIVAVALETAQIPHEYRPIITNMLHDGFKRHAVAADYEKYFTDSVQPYSFSVYLPKSRFERMIMLESAKVKIIFSTCEKSCYDDFKALFDAMLGEKLEMAENKWTVRFVADVAEKEIKGNQIHIRMLSPLVVLRQEPDGQGKVHLLGLRDADFEAILNQSVEKQAKALLGMPPEKAQIHVLPCQEGFRAKDVHVLHEGSYLRSTVGDMNLCADAELLKFLYECGMGEMREKGFGLFEVVE